MSSGNGFDNAHNNAFGGGGRGPTGGVNMGSGTDSGGNAGRGPGYWNYDTPQSPTYYDKTGQPIITVIAGPTWVHDDSLHWSKGNSGDGNDNLRMTGTAEIKNGYRAAAEGYIFTVTVNGNNQITSVNLYSRPALPSRKDWKTREAALKESAKAQVQQILDQKKADADAAAKKAAEQAAAAAAAAEAKRKAEEEAKRKQAEWDAAHPVEAAQRDLNTANTNATNAQNTINADNQKINSNNQGIASRQPQVDQLSKEVDSWGAQVRGLQGVDPARANMILHTQLDPRKQKRDQLQNEINSFRSQNDALRNDIANQTAALNKANQDRSAAQARLNKAQADADAKRKAEAQRQAAEQARVKAEQAAAAKAKADAEAKAKAAAEAATKDAAIEAAKSRLEEPNVFSMNALASAVGTALSPMAFSETGLGAITLTGTAASGAWAFVRGVVSELLGITAVGSGIGALIAAIGYIPKAGEGSDKVPGRNNINMFSTAMDTSALNLPSTKELKALLKSGGSVMSSVRGRVYFDDNKFNTELVRTEKPSAIPVVKAVKDPITGFYGYTVPATDTLPSRTILVSPTSVPGSGGLPPLVNPVIHEVGGTNTGNQNTPDTDLKITSYPLSDEPDFNDFILVFEELDLKPIYVMLQDSLDDGRYTRKQLDRKFKHAPDFGVHDTKKNRETLTKFRDAIESHLVDSSTIEKGTYLLVDGSKVHFNPKSLRVVVLDKEGMFVSGWVLDPTGRTEQYDNYMKTGVLR